MQLFVSRLLIQNLESLVLAIIVDVQKGKPY